MSEANTIIEAGIRPVCDVLNRMPGVTTVYSCEGHWLRKQPPYVMFDAPQEAAFRIHQLLENGRAGGKTKINWWLQARFQESGGLRYILQTNDRRIRENAPWWTSWPLWIRMNKDLERLAGVLMHDEVLKQTLNRVREAIGDSQVQIHEKAGQQVYRPSSTDN